MGRCTVQRQETHAIAISAGDPLAAGEIIIEPIQWLARSRATRLSDLKRFALKKRMPRGSRPRGDFTVKVVMPDDAFPCGAYQGAEA